MYQKLPYFYSKKIPKLFYILLILLFPIIILIGGGYGGCAYLLFAKTNKITSAFRLPTIFKMMFGNIMPIIKAILWIIFLFIPLVVIQISLYIIAAAIPIIALPVWIAITYCFYMFISNISAQLLRHISQNMGEELH